MTHTIKKTLIYVLVLILLSSLIPLFLIRNSRSNSSKKDLETGGKGKEKLILGFSQIGNESAWRTRNTQSIQEAAAVNNIQLLYDDAQQKQENQLKAIRSFIVQQVDVIAFVPIVNDGWDNVLQEAKEANIPVIIVDRQINTSPDLYAGFLGENGFEEGLTAANFLIKKCRNIKKDKINIVEFAGTEGSSVATERAEGFRSVISRDSRLRIIHSEDGDFLRSRGKEMMDKILAANHGMHLENEPIDVIYSHNDSMTLGLLDSLEENNITSRNTIIISIDAEQKSIDALTQGKLNCVVECNPNLGPQLMKLVKDIAEGKEIPRISYTHETVFLETDDFSTYEPRGY